MLGLGLQPVLAGVDILDAQLGQQRIAVAARLLELVFLFIAISKILPYSFPPYIAARLTAAIVGIAMLTLALVPGLHRAGVLYAKKSQYELDLIP